MYMGQWLSQASCYTHIYIYIYIRVKTQYVHATHTHMRMDVHVPCACRLFMIIGWFMSARFTSGAKCSRGVTHISSNLCLNWKRNKENGKPLIFVMKIEEKTNRQLSN